MDYHFYLSSLSASAKKITINTELFIDMNMGLYIHNVDKETDQEESLDKKTDQEK